MIYSKMVSTLRFLASNCRRVSAEGVRLRAPPQQHLIPRNCRAISYGSQVLANTMVKCCL